MARNWNAFAADDPMWSILTWEDKRGNRRGVDEFFSTGRAEITDVLGQAREYQPALANGRASDFGCGVGRLSMASVSEFEELPDLAVCGGPSPPLWIQNLNGCTEFENSSQIPAPLPVKFASPPEFQEIR